VIVTFYFIQINLNVVNKQEVCIAWEMGLSYAIRASYVAIAIFEILLSTLKLSNKNIKS